ncbi:right-handed parallel beta-helix repeat-containing protein [Candidatus Bathyarchaeota archaeon]|nr:right-handed parallel beta-helix repeat-containing protein [Candidatus Bathyarchaeota archaeon]
MRKTLFVLLLLVTLVAALCYTPKVGGVETTGSIIIFPDGSIYPETAPIFTVDNLTYVLTDDIVWNTHSSGAVLSVRRNNIVLDGADHVISNNGFGNPAGIELALYGTAQLTNITVENFFITRCNWGIYMYNCTFCTVHDIVIFECKGNSLQITDSLNISVHDVTIYDGESSALVISYSSECELYNNSVSQNKKTGISLSYSERCSIHDNIIKDNAYGIGVKSCSNLTIYANSVEENEYDGVKLQLCLDTTVSKNKVLGNWEKGLALDSSFSNIVHNNTVSDNYYGIYVYNSSENTIYYNDFIYSSIEVYVEQSGSNVWDNGFPSGGNYWSDYTSKYPNAAEIDASGIWDTPYFIDENNTDRYPFIRSHPRCIYVRANGTVEPSGLNLTSSDSNTYVFTGNVYYPIVVEKGNIVIDGNGRVLYGDAIEDGFEITDVNNVTIRNVIIARWDNGITVQNSSENCLCNNTISNIWSEGIRLSGYGVSVGNPMHNMIVENTITNCGYHAIALYYSYNNTIHRNYIAKTSGIMIYTSNYNVLAFNNIVGNWLGICISEYSHHNTITSNFIIHSESYAIFLFNTDRNLIVQNNLADASYGIFFLASSNNTIYHNNLNCTMPAILSDTLMESWDDGVEGNYWGSNYTGVDTNHDGIGDTPYTIKSNNIDYYPLMAPFTSLSTSYGYAVDFISNSSVTDLNFTVTDPNLATLIFKVSGENGTGGFCRIRIPTALINGSFVVKLDGEILAETQFRILPVSNGAYTYLYLNYTHSNHTIEITGTTTIPEFPPFLVLPLLMIATIWPIIAYKRKLETTST